MHIDELLGLHLHHEQPKGSMLVDLPEFDRMFTTTFGANARTITWLGAFGGTCPKPIWLMGTGAWKVALRRRKPILRDGVRIHLVRRAVDAQGRRRVWGKDREMKQSANYPLLFGRAVIDAFLS